MTMADGSRFTPAAVSIGNCFFIVIGGEVHLTPFSFDRIEPEQADEPESLCANPLG
jgi:hypothetical protein